MVVHRIACTGSAEGSGAVSGPGHQSMKKLILVLLAICIPLAGFGQRRSGSSHRSTSSHSTRSSPSSSKKTSIAKPRASKAPGYRPAVRSNSQKAGGVQRDSKGKIKRSSSAKEKFMNQTGYPKGRPGYVIDHVTPLSKGGKDDPGNMQWQTKEAAKAKDKWERGQSTNSKPKRR